MTRYPLTEHRAALGRLTREPAKCTCAPLNPRHVEPWHCLTVDEIAVWQAKHPSVLCSPIRARIFAWLEKEFGR